VVLEIAAGIVVGPSVLGWVEIDQTIAVMSTLGLAFLLFLAGLEIDFSRLRGRVLTLTATGFALSFAIALVVGLGLQAAGLVDAPLLVAIALVATSLGVLIPVLKDAGESTSTLGQLVIAAGSIADFGAIILLSIFFTGEGGTGATLLLIGSLLGLAVVVLLAVRGADRSMRIRADLLHLQDTTAQIRVRGAMVLLVGFAATAQSLGLEAILGAFAAGAILTLLDADEVMTHPQFRRKLEAIGFGFFIPVFFVTTGVRYDLDALLASASTVVMVPVFLAALLAVRGLPALLYRRLLGPRQAVIAGLLQSTSLPFIVAATAIGLDLGVIDAATSAALIAAGLLSVVIFPATGLALLRAGATPRTPPPVAEETPLVAM
jgi:Kef-type K+ transport system membrane component KefB